MKPNFASKMLFFTMLALVLAVPAQQILSPTQATFQEPNSPAFTVHLDLSANVLYSGSNEILTANVIGGVPPYSYNFTIYNSSNTEVANTLYTEVNSTSNTLSFTQNTLWGSGIFVVKAAIEDSKAVIASNSVTYNAVSTSTTTSISTTSKSTTTSIVTPTTTIRQGERLPASIYLNNALSQKIPFNSTLLDSIDISMKSGMAANIVVNTSTNNPEGVPVPSGVYRYIKITEPANLDRNISNVIYTFNVTRSWVTAQHTGNGNIRLFKYYNNGWRALPTSFVGRSATYYTYSAVSNSLSTYAVGFVTGGATATTNSTTLTLASGYPAYFFGTGAEEGGVRGATPSFNVNEDVIIQELVTKGKPADLNSNSSIIGHTTNDTASVFLVGGATSYNISLAGVGANVILANNGVIFTSKTNTTTAPSLAFTTLTSNSFVVLLADSAGSKITATSFPAGCTTEQDVNSTITSSIAAICTIAAAGSQTAGITVGTSTQSAMAAYVFPEYHVVLNDNPSTATIATNGNTYASGAAMNVIGTNTLTANPPTTGSYVFNGWTVSNSNLTLSSSTVPTINLTVMGNGIVTASWNSVTSFTETGLPSGSKWNVTYNGVLNFSITNTIKFFTSPGTYGYTIPNQVVSGTTYVPSPSSGNLISSNTLNVSFTTSTTSTSTSTTSTTSTSTTSTVLTTIYSNEYITYGNTTTGTSTPLSLILKPNYKTYFYLYGGITAVLLTPPVPFEDNWSTTTNYTYENEFCPTITTTTVANNPKISKNVIFSKSNFNLLNNPYNGYGGLKTLNLLVCTPKEYGFNMTNIGHSTENVGTVIYGNYPSNLSLSGIGADVLLQNGNVFDKSGLSGISENLSYTVQKNNSFVILAESVTPYHFSSMAVPPSCALISNSLTSLSSAQTVIYACRQNSGSYNSEVTPSGNSSYSMASYVFPPYKVFFDDNPSNGTITLNTTSYTNGQSAELIGTYNITANPPPGYTFSNWEVTNSINLTVANLNSDSTTLTIAGNGTITADFKSNSITSTCTISVTPNTIDFGTLYPNQAIPTDETVTDTNSGNTQASILVYGGNWIGPTSFGVSNTIWAATSNAAFPANRLSTTATNTLISVPASSSNDIYFGLGIPDGAPDGHYSQTITIENSC